MIINWCCTISRKLSFVITAYRVSKHCCAGSIHGWGLLEPVDFIGFAELGETIHALTNWVIDNGLAQLRRWHDDGYDFCLAINISTRNLVDQAFPATLKGLIDKQRIAASCVELEITGKKGTEGLNFNRHETGRGYSIRGHGCIP